MFTYIHVSHSVAYIQPQILPASSMVIHYKHFSFCTFSSMKEISSEFLSHPEHSIIWCSMFLYHAVQETHCFLLCTNNIFKQWKMCTLHASFLILHLVAFTWLSAPSTDLPDELEEASEAPEQVSPHSRTPSPPVITPRDPPKGTRRGTIAKPGNLNFIRFQLSLHHHGLFALSTKPFLAVFVFADVFH